MPQQTVRRRIAYGTLEGAERHTGARDGILFPSQPAHSRGLVVRFGACALIILGNASWSSTRTKL